MGHTRDHFRVTGQRWAGGLALLVCLLWTVSATAMDQAPSSPRRFMDRFRALNRPAVGNPPNSMNRSHRVGNVWMTITNYGIFGANFMDQWDELVEPDGTPAPSFEFPAGTRANYLYAGSIWFGAVVDIDTLVSVGADGWMRINEMFPAAIPNGEIIERSTRKSSLNYSPDAVSEQDYIAEFFDTLAETAYAEPDPYDGRPHQPIGLRVVQKSYSWSYEYAQDFILLDYTIYNISSKNIRSPYMALYVDADCWNRALPLSREGFRDDYSGYKLTVPSAYPGLQDTINIAWTSDNDGDPSGGAFDYTSCTAVAGTRVVRGPLADSGGCGPAPLNYSFNWWTSESNTSFDWGPRDRRNHRDFGTGGEGTPAGDPNKYYIMSNREFDYDQLFAGIDYSDSTFWLAPKNKQLAGNIADGYDTRYLFSFGPLKDLKPGDSVSLTIGYVGGDNFHVNADDFKKYFDADKPSVFYSKLDFTDFGVNAQWAAWVFDNPGVDTPDPFTGITDGCRGLYYLVNCLDTTYEEGQMIVSRCDTFYYAGDGIPDFKGPPPPPPPQFEIESQPGTVIIRWTGQLSELIPDDFSLKRDFEGYRFYMGELNNLNSMSLVASWDLVDYKRMDYNSSTNRFTQRLNPLSTAQLKAMYGESFDPEQWNSPQNVYHDTRGEVDTVFYLASQDFNLNNQYGERGTLVDNVIQRVGIDSAATDSFLNNDTTVYIYEKFGVYEARVTNLLASKPMYFSVTAFDFGNPITSLLPLESSPIANSQLAYPAYSASVVEQQGLSVSVYPNPYKISDDYRGRGYEDPFKQGWSERKRQLHFINLPSEATIKIFTLDGDLVREIHHPDPVLSDSDSHLAWDLISRNTQAVVSGIYYYAVESAQGTQIGKLVIIK